MPPPAKKQKSKARQHGGGNEKGANAAKHEVGGDKEEAPPAEISVGEGDAAASAACGSVMSADEQELMKNAKAAEKKDNATESAVAIPERANSTSELSVDLEALLDDAPDLLPEAASEGKGEEKARLQASVFHAPPIDNIWRCVRCRKEVDVAKDQCLRLKGKVLGVFKCNTCNTRGTQLSRIDSWQTLLKSYQGYSEDQ